MNTDLLWDLWEYSRWAIDMGVGMLTGAVLGYCKGLIDGQTQKQEVTPIR